METTGNYTGWNGNIDDLPDDTPVTVILGDIRKHNKKTDGIFELMSMIGKTGKHVMIRYDPERDYNGKYFTVVISDPDLPIEYRIWRTDTENPIEALYIYLESGTKRGKT